ncbi:MAG: hypothetical protein RR998_09785 [Oscillospiraceae bacterium]
MTADNDFFTMLPDDERLRGGLSSGVDLKPHFNNAKNKKSIVKPKKYKKKVTLSNVTARRPRKVNKWVVAVIVTLTLVVALSLIIAEPWVRPALDTYVAPTEPETLPNATIELGESYAFGIELADNEQISNVVVKDADILEVMMEGDIEKGVKALGEFPDTSVTFEVSELSLPRKQYAHTIEFAGFSLTQPYDAVRSWFRSTLGIEKTISVRTELRILRLYEQKIAVSGTDRVTTSQPAITLKKGDTEDIELVLAQRESAGMTTSDAAVVSVRAKDEDTSGTFAIKAVGTGKASIVARIGFWKAVEPDIYAAWLASQPTPSVDETKKEDEPAPVHQNEIFVCTRVISYPVIVE